MDNGNAMMPDHASDRTGGVAAPRPLALQTERLHEQAAAWLAGRCELIRCAPGDARFDELIATAEALVVRTYTHVDATLLARAPRLRVVGRAGVGLDNIDLAACADRGVTVVHTPEANTRAVVEYVFTMLLDALRPRTFLDRAIGATRWAELRAELTAPRQLADLTLGIYGLGRIGSRVARAGASFGMRVVYNDLREIPPDAREGATPVSPEELLGQADILTIHVDGRPSNRHLLNAASLALLRDDVILVNAARGFILDAAALGGWLLEHPAAMAIIDVHEPEPFTADYPLLVRSNAYLTPHIAAATDPANLNMSWVVRDVWRVLTGQQPRFPATADGAGPASD